MAAVYFVLIGVGQVAGLTSRLQLDRALERRQRELAPAQANVASLQVSLLDQSSGMRGFVITGREELLASYDKGRLDQTAALGRLRADLRTTPEALRLVNEVEAAAGAWQVEVAIPAVAATREGHQAQAATVIAEKGTLLFDKVRSQLAGLTDAMSELVDAGQRQIDAAKSDLATRMLVQNVAGLVLFVATIGLLRRWITEPIVNLSANVRRVADGDLDRMIEPSGPPELADLGRDVERMRRRILTELDTAVAAVEALEQGAPIVVGLRSELASRPDADAEGLVVAGRLHAAEGVLAGDWYDLVVLDDHRAALVMVDISGHGAVAGLFAVRIKHLLEPALRFGMGPGAALDWVAGQLGDTGDRFATCLVVEIDHSTGACRYANAGHPPGLVVRPGGVEELAFTGPMLGPLDGAWATRTTHLGPADLLAAYTDGVVEARDEAGTEFGIERLVAILAARRGDAPDTVADDVIAEVRQFGARGVVDDETLVILKLKPAP